MLSASEVRNRKRDLRQVDLSDEARADLARLRTIRFLIARAERRIAVLKSERLMIWRRRDEVGDVWRSELARASDVTQPFVSREIQAK